MNKFIKILALAGVIIFTPALVSAHGNENKKDDHDRGEIRGQLKGKIEAFKKQHTNGSVSAVSSTGFTLNGKDGKTYTVVTSNAKISQAFGDTIALSSITVGSNAEVFGKIDGSTITAQKVIITPANSHKAQGSGTVTAVNGNNVTVQQNHHGIVSSFTVVTNASTTITSGNSTTTPTSVTVGSKVKVKGFWDEVLNVLKAISIKIK